MKLALATLFLALSLTAAVPVTAATCNPYGTCHACKNCRYCHNCNHGGPKCSVWIDTHVKGHRKVISKGGKQAGCCNQVATKPKH